MVFGLLNITRDTFLAPLGLLPLSRTFAFEVLDMIIMAFAIGYIFKDYFRPPVAADDPVSFYKKNRWDAVKFGAIVAGLAVVAHELAHKFVAMYFGATAIVYAPYGFYALVVILKAIGFPFLFFVGGFVAHTPLPALQSALVSLAGPAANFLLWGIATYVVKKKKLTQKQLTYVVPLAKINLFLGAFNMIPFPGFDGFNAIAAILKFIG